MAKRETKDRSYQCQLCRAPLAEDELGYICQHVAHGAWVTVFAEPRAKGQRMPDMACTACGIAMSRRKKNAEDHANIHIVCEPCYRAARARNIDDFTQADVARGYVLVPRTHYDRIVKREIKRDIGPLKVGRELKLGFAPIPCTHPLSLERMWVRLTCVLEGGVVHGVLANDPELFKRKVLKANDTVVFRARHVLETEVPKPMRKGKAEPKPKKPARKPTPEPKPKKPTAKRKTRR